MDLEYKSFKEVFKNLIFGIILGFSIIVPGLSGSVLAIIMNLYDKIIFSLSNLSKSFKKSIIFLLPLIFGGSLGVLIGSIIIKLVFNMYPFYLICLFSGLMIGSFQIIFKQIKKYKFNKYNILFLMFGFLISISLFIFSFVNKENDISNYNFKTYLLFLLIGIGLAITQLVPGLSATALLIVIGYYSYLINILDFKIIYNFNHILVVFMILFGLIIGVLLFSKLINYFLEYKKEHFMYLITGLSIGSLLCVFFEEKCIYLYKIWNLNDFIINGLIGLIFLIIGILFMTIILDFFNKRRRINEK